jgi:membrane-bound lytic murein transglycosylase A
LIEASWRDLPGWGSDDLAPALTALLESCKASKSALPALLCADAAKQVGAGNGGLQQFFEARFAPHQVVNADGTREGLITGYYEPLLKGSRKRSRANAWPIHGVPDDLLSIDLGEHFPELKGARLRGRLDGRKVVPYWSREELAQRDRQTTREALFWLADPIEAFFLQVQGSGRIDLDDGTRVRVAYADQNGHPYRSIGRWLVDKGELKVEQASLDGIRNWARANPSRLDELLNANPSYVFFREVAGANGKAGKDIGPAGTLGVPLTPGRSIAVDPRAIPLGAPVWLATTHPGTGKPLQRLMNAQDTGGAIKGGVRADFFWGFGAEAGALAGRMRPSGRLWVLLPRAMP